MSLPIRRKPAKEFTVAVTDQPIVVRPISADKMAKIEERFPYDLDMKQRKGGVGFHAAVIAEACCCQVGTKEAPKPGEQAWSETELRGMDAAYFWDVWAVVNGYLSLLSDDESKKNGSLTASDSPSASP